MCSNEDVRRKLTARILLALGDSTCRRPPLGTLAAEVVLTRVCFDRRQPRVEAQQLDDQRGRHAPTLTAMWQDWT